MAEPLVVYLAYPAVAALDDTDRLRAIDPRIEIVTADYDVPHAFRVAKEQNPSDPGLAALEPPLTDAQRNAWGRAHVAVALDAPLSLATVAPHLEWIQSIGSGVGQFAASGLAAAGVTLTNAAGVGAPPIAEWVVGRILQVTKAFDVHDRQQRDRVWQFALGDLLMGKTVAIIGLGAIGRATAQRLRPFGVRLIGTRASWRPGMTDPDVDELAGPDALHDVVGRADIVVVAAPGHAESEDMFDAATFAAMRPGSIFVNVARGTLVDETALVAALASGHLRAAAIDVSRNEPIPPDDPLWDAPNLFISPHSSASQVGYMERVLDLFEANLRRRLAGEPMVNVIDLSGGY